LSSASNANYGWFAGGLPLPAVTASTVDRINFSNDTGTAAARGPLTVARSDLTATGNANYGWFGGGVLFTPVVFYSTVERIDYANDSPTSASPRGPLSAVQYKNAATSNANYGWFGGGKTPTSSPTILSTIERIDFANDSPSASSPRGPLLTGRSSLSATGNANYGWFTGGQIPSNTSIVERIDFANDSPTSASPRGPLSAARYFHGNASNYVQSRTELIASSPVNWPGGAWIRGGLSIA
jgi:hypothetical protein